ncbi:MAG TPA: Ig domain-containing protein, partial [Candidatus Kapabacteria bacterium]|nr:Ig domain-containing protein [Candidatus Kapabacteria bacterium]
MMPKNIFTSLRGWFLIAVALVCGALLMPSASGQNIGMVSNVTATWSSADTISLNWSVTTDSLAKFVYRIYTAPGSIQDPNGKGWRFVKTVADTSANIGLDELDLTKAQTMSFFVTSAAVLANGDTAPGQASNTAVAVWNNTIGHGEITLLFTSTPGETGTIGKAYTYQIAAISNDPTSVITYSLVQAPDGMNIDTATGMITWLPLHSGSFVVNVQASDNHGNTIHQEYTITVGSGDDFTSVVGIVTDANTGKGISGTQLTFTLIDTASSIVRTFTASCADNGAFS